MPRIEGFDIPNPYSHDPNNDMGGDLSNRMYANMAVDKLFIVARNQILNDRPADSIVSELKARLSRRSLSSADRKMIKTFLEEITPREKKGKSSHAK